MRRLRRDAIVEQLGEMNRRADERHEQLLARGKASERVFIEALTDIDRSIQRNTETIERNTQRLDDMGASIRANTRAVLSVLDRLEPSSG